MFQPCYWTIRSLKNTLEDKFYISVDNTCYYKLTRIVNGV
jgi:hypothetical protein